MNTAGHAKIAEEVGLPLLVEAFRERGYERLPLNAFPLGNWLTDVQQAVDPVAADPESAKQRIAELADELVSSLYLDVPGPDRLAGWVRNLSGRAARVIRDGQRTLEEALDVLFAPTGVPGEVRRNRVFDTLRTTFRVLGYFSFVHPVSPSIRLDHEPRSGYRMDAGAYFAIYQEMFTQYYPHDHMDRPELRNPPKVPPDFRSEIATGPRAQGRSSLSPDLYAYLREDLEIAAGRLARVDVEFAAPTFVGRRPPQPDDVGWNLALARLGRALHAVEDFFAHSTFTEHAVALLGEDHLPTSVVGQPIYHLRLQRWQRTLPDRPPPAPQPEPHVVTGWFDLQDTLISLGHAAELMFGVRFRDPQVRVADALDAARKATSRQDILLFEIQQLLYEASEVLDDPQRALEDRDNSVAQQIRGRVPVTALGQPVTTETVQRLLRDAPLFHEVPPETQADIVNALVVLHGAYRIGSATYSAYRALRAVHRFIQNPLSTVLGWIRTAVGDAAAEAVRFYVQDRIEELLGARRIGCHSVLAKDHDEAVLHDPAWNLAAGVHWYVLSVFTRRHSTFATGTPSTPHVDWFDLLEFFLRHPRGGLNVRAAHREVCVTVAHVVDNIRRVDSLAALGIRYAPTSCAPARFTWKSIADANFGTAQKSARDTQRVVNRSLATRRNGYVVRDGINYAFNPGLIVLIPDQRRRIEVYHAEQASTGWWREVLTHDTWEVFPGYADPERRMSVPPIDVGYTPRLLSAQQTGARIAAADALLQRREASYR